MVPCGLSPVTGVSRSPLRWEKRSAWGGGCPIVSMTSCLANAPEKCTQSRNFELDIKSPSQIWFQNTVCPKTKDAFLKIQAWAYNRYSCTLASVTSCVNVKEFLKDTTTADDHENVAWKSESHCFSLSLDYSNSLILSNASELFWSWFSINNIQVHEENEFCHCLFTSLTKGEITHFHG